jgi:hypothetical protein
MLEPIPESDGRLAVVVAVPSDSPEVVSVSDDLAGTWTRIERPAEAEPLFGFG